MNIEEIKRKYAACVDEVGIIQAASLSTADHGILSSYITMEMSRGGVQGFGGYRLGYDLNKVPGDKYDNVVNITMAADWIVSVMKVAGVANWHDLVGKTVSVLSQGGLIIAIGQFGKSDNWYCPKLKWSCS